MAEVTDYYEREHAIMQRLKKGQSKQLKSANIIYELEHKQFKRLLAPKPKFMRRLNKVMQL